MVVGSPSSSSGCHQSTAEAERGGGEIGGCQTKTPLSPSGQCVTRAKDDTHQTVVLGYQLVMISRHPHGSIHILE